MLILIVFLKKKLVELLRNQDSFHLKMYNMKVKLPLTNFQS